MNTHKRSSNSRVCGEQVASEVLNRTPERIRDDLTATALGIGDERGRCVAFVAMDLMNNDAQFTRNIREQVAARTDIPKEGICVNFSHSHNARTAGYARGVGEI